MTAHASAATTTNGHIEIAEKQLSLWAKWLIGGKLPSLYTTSNKPCQILRVKQSSNDQFNW